MTFSVPTRRCILLALPAMVLGIGALGVRAQGDSASPAPSASQNFPTGLVRIIVPFPAGGGTDVLARLLSSTLQNLWSQSVILENRPGAAGLIGTRAVAAAPGDGHTLLMASTGAVLALAASEAAGASAAAAATTSGANSHPYRSSPLRPIFWWHTRRFWPPTPAN